MISTSPYSTKLINFNIPLNLINDFDDLIKFKNVSRTSILNRLIENYIRVEFRLLETDNRFKRLLSDVRLRNKKVPKPEILNEFLKHQPVHKSITEELHEDYIPPDIPSLTQTLSDDFDWETRLK